MTNKTSLAFAYNDQKDIHDVVKRQPADDRCFKEVFEVLERHGLEKRYGLTLLHKHFDLNADEIMVEHTNIAARTLTSIPMKVTDAPKKNLVEVTWQLGADNLMTACVSHCYYDDSMPRHETRHNVRTRSEVPEPLGM